MPEKSERNNNLDNDNPAAAKSAEDIKAAVQKAAVRRVAEQGASARLADRRAAEALGAVERRAAKRIAAANRAAASEAAANRAEAGEAVSGKTAVYKAAVEDNNLKGCAIPIAIFIALSIITFIIWKYSPGFSFESFPGFSRNAASAADTEQQKETTASKNDEGKSFLEVLASVANTQGEESDSGTRGQASEREPGPGQPNGENVSQPPAESQARQPEFNAGAGLQSDTGSVASLTDSVAPLTDSVAPLTDSDALLAEYADLIIKHDLMTATVDKFIAGGIEPVEFREICEEINDYFNDAVDRLNFIIDSDGTRKNILMAAALSDQIASASILKYFDSGVDGELLDPASNYNRNAADAGEAYAAFADLYR